MMRFPFRSFDPAIVQEPLIYRLVEAMQHYGEGIKVRKKKKKERKEKEELKKKDLLFLFFFLFPLHRILI